MLGESMTLGVASVWMGMTEGGAVGVVGWMGAMLFGLGALLAIGILLPNSTSLRLTPEGFWIRIVFRSIPLIRWNQVERSMSTGAAFCSTTSGGAEEPYLTPSECVRRSWRRCSTSGESATPVNCRSTGRSCGPWYSSGRRIGEMMVIGEEIAYFHENRLLGEHQGEFALIKGPHL
jgi:hypothetical protein